MDKHISLYMQPAYNYGTQQIEYAEILTRKYNNIENIGEILKFVELYGIESEFDLDVLAEALKTLSKFDKLKYPVGINVCSNTIKIPDIYKKILDIISTYNTANNEIIIEINEKTDFSDENVQNNINHLRDNGIKIALDDFGVHSSNLSTLINYKIDILKVDKAFINSDNNKEHEESQSKLLRVLFQICDEFNLKHIVEGIETNKQLKNVQKLGYNIVQGYLYEKPVPLSEFLNCENN